MITKRLRGGGYDSSFDICKRIPGGPSFQFVLYGLSKYNLYKNECFGLKDSEFSDIKGIQTELEWTCGEERIDDTHSIVWGVGINYYFFVINDPLRSFPNLRFYGSMRFLKIDLSSFQMLSTHINR